MQMRKETSVTVICLQIRHSSVITVKASLQFVSTKKQNHL